MPGPTPAGQAITAGPGIFDVTVARGTGLELATVRAWRRAENGPGFNYLGLKDSSGSFATFANAKDAADAVVANLRTPKYASVITTAHSTSDPKVELAAIADSPWDTGKAGPKPGYLKLLLGALASNQSQDPHGATDAAGAATGTGPSGTGAGIDFGGMFGGLEKWLQKESATALAYVMLTTLGLVLVVLGALDLLGYSPARVAGAITPTPGRKEAIPF